MNNLVFFCLIMLICLRGIGLGVSFDFFHDTHDKKFIYFNLCWSFWIIANIFPIFIDLIGVNWIKELFLIFNIIASLVAILFYNWGFIKYYMTVSSRIMLTLITFAIITPFLLYFFISYTIAINFASVAINISLLSGYIIPPLKIKKFKEYLGKTVRWYYATLSIFFLYFPVSLINFLSGYRYGLYFAENPISILLNYIPAILSTVLLIILLVHLEYTISSREKFNLKDKYSHDLGNIMQAIFSSLDLIKLRGNINKEDKKDLDLIQTKSKEASILIKNIRKL